MQFNESFAIAIDAPAQRRPGVPAEREPEPVANAHWVEPDKQPRHAGVVMDASRSEPTATFGTGQRPRGVSGLLRRAAYRVPDYQPQRWLLLMVADRVDSMESSFGRLAAHPATWAAAAGVAGLWAATRARRRARFSWLPWDRR